LPRRTTDRFVRGDTLSFEPLRHHLGVDLVVAEGRHIALKAQTLQPCLYVHAVILDSEESQPLANKDIPLPVDLPAAGLK
jgi:hypothetical protein